jgi:hypothetical protein
LQCYDLRRELKEGHCYNIDCAVARTRRLRLKERVDDGVRWNLYNIVYDVLTERKCYLPWVCAHTG